MHTLVDEVPRSVIAALIKKMLPRQPVSVRAPEGGWKSDHAGLAKSNRFAGGAAMKARKTRRSKKSNRHYTVINPSGYANHRASWRRAMVEAILNNACEQDALAEMEATWRERKPAWADKGIDLMWVANEACYIELED